MAAHFLKKIAEDVFHDDVNVRVLALSTVCQLGADSVSSAAEAALLARALEEAASEASPQDVRFLARKGLNHLRTLSGGQPAPAAVPAAAPAPTRESALAALDGPAREAAEACAVLSRLGLASDVPALLPLLAHEDARVRSNAIEALAGLADAGTLVEALVPLYGDPDNRVRGTVAAALGRLGHPTVITYLEQLLADERLSMRESAVYALTTLQGPDVVRLLVNSLQDSYEGVRLRAAQGLAACGDASAIEALRATLSDPDPAVGEAAATALSFLAPQAQPAPDEGPVEEPEAPAPAEAPAAEAAAPEIADYRPEEAASPEARPDPEDLLDDLLADVDAGPTPEPELRSGEENAVPVRSAPPPGLVPENPIERPAASKRDIVGSLAKAAESILGPSNSYLVSMRSKVQGLDVEALKALREFEVRAVGDAVFQKMRSGELTHDKLNQTYYDILKYNEFNRKQQEKEAELRAETRSSGIFSRLGKKLGIVKSEEGQLHEAIERIEKRLDFLRADLGRGTLTLLAKDRIEFEGGREMYEAFRFLERRIASGGADEPDDGGPQPTAQ